MPIVSPKTMGKPYVDLCQDGVTVRLARTSSGYAITVWEGEGETKALATLPCTLADLWSVTRGAPLHVSKGKADLQLSVEGPLVDVRFANDGETPRTCEIFRRDYTKALVDLVVDR